MHQTIPDLVGSYGYLIIFLLVGIESFGIPLPGETALVTAAAFAAGGRLNIALVILSAAAGAIIGDNAGYWVGRTGGIALVRRYGRRFGLDEAKLKRAQDFFERHGAKTIFIGRFIALLRSWAAALAGVARMPYRTFMFYNALGGVIWAAVFGGLGYIFGRNLPLLERYVGQLSVALVLLATLAVVVFFVVRSLRVNGESLSAGVSRVRKRVATSARLTRVQARNPKLWSFLSARFARGEYLGLHLTLGFMLSLAALWIFGGVTEDVIHNDPLTAVDVQLASWMRAHASPMGDRLAVMISIVGSPVALATVAVTGSLMLVQRRWWTVLAVWVAAFVGGGALAWALKQVVHRPRPAGAQVFLYGTSSSFPSAHAMLSLIGYGMLAHLLISFWPWARRHRVAVALGTCTVVLLIALSRLYLGVNFLSDVIGGYAAGLVWLATCVTMVDIAIREPGLMSPEEKGRPRKTVSRAASPA
jgi:membrane protein DedA with SNARE-associated domain/membrane-associated phospholipid phosphatase